MLGGGSFTVQNKILPGAYINFVSPASSVAVLSDRGTAAIPLEFGWGPEKEAFVRGLSPGKSGVSIRSLQWKNVLVTSSYWAEGLPG